MNDQTPNKLLHSWSWTASFSPEKAFLASVGPDFLDIDEFEHRLEVDQRKVDDHPEPI